MRLCHYVPDQVRPVHIVRDCEGGVGGTALGEMLPAGIHLIRKRQWKRQSGVRLGTEQRDAASRSPTGRQRGIPWAAALR